MTGLKKLIGTIDETTQSINKLTQKQIDKLLKLRKQRMKDSATSTIDSRDTPSAEEFELQRILEKKDVDIPGLSRTQATRKGAGGETPLNAGETNKLKTLATKVEKFAAKENYDKADAAYDAFVTYENRLVTKYGSAIMDHTADLSPKYHSGGSVKKPKKKAVAVTIAVGTPKKNLKDGGMAYGKRHNYFAGGSVRDNRKK